MNRRLICAASACLALAAGAAWAQASLEPDHIPAGVYTLDSKEALVRYTTLHMGLTDFWGTFPGATGTLTIDPKALANTKVDVTVPIATVETTNSELNGEFRSAQFFDAEKYPTMHFVSTGLTRTGPRTAKLAGDLTLHGVTRPIVLQVTFNAALPNAFSKVLTLGFRAEGVIKRSDFGVGKWVPIVSDETRITISAPFEKK